MATETLTHTDLLVRLSRRQLWFAVLCIVVIGALALAMLVAPGSELAARADGLLSWLPILIGISALMLQSTAKGVDSSPSSPAMQAMLGDELRQASLNRAYRNALACTLLMQPLLALTLVVTELANPVAVMACATSVGAVLTVLLSHLYYDR